MKKVLITGISGFIGQALAEHFKQKGWFVIGVSRSSQVMNADLAISRSLGEPLGAGIKGHQIDAIIHGAQFTGPNDYEINTQGTLLWAEEAQQAGIPIQIFLGSISATPNSVSSYGQSKYFLEKWFVEKGFTVAKPGLVIGMGGIFGKMVNSVRRNRILPLIDGGRDLVFYTGLSTLIDFVNKVLDGKIKPGSYFLHHQDPAPLVLILKEIGKKLGIKNIFIPIPSWPILVFLKSLEALRIPFIISSQNIRGLKQNNHFREPSDLPRMGLESPSLPQLLQKNSIC